MKLIMFFYYSWSLYFISKFDELKEHLKHLLDRKCHLTSFYDFDFLHAVSLYYSKNTNDTIKKDNDSLMEAKKYLLKFLSENDNKYTKNIETSTEELINEIFRYDIGNMKREKCLASKYYIGLISLKLNENEQAYEFFLSLLCEISGKNNHEAALNSVKELINKQYDMFDFKMVLNHMIEILYKKDEELNGNVGNKYEKSTQFIEKMIELNGMLRFPDHRIQENIIFYKAKISFTNYMDNQTDNVPEFLSAFEKISKDSRNYASANYLIAVYYSEQKNYQMSEEYLEIAENATRNDEMLSNIKALKVKMLYEKLKNSMDEKLKAEFEEVLESINKTKNKKADIGTFWFWKLESDLMMIIGEKKTDFNQKLHQNLNELNSACYNYPNKIEFIYLKGLCQYHLEMYENSEDSFDSYIAKAIVSLLVNIKLKFTRKKTPMSH